ncbi:VOC family protein [Streptomyces sp. NRRL S-87]|uniref:VOC family protein n=1 Tax=Streptomyces sp. NRRL S-87 TaxID=1463920 RepID=UPI0004C077FF|nr:VOC family protein [Streptomyces sp. NRRL S-87]
MSATMIFVNLPVKDLEASKGFYGKLGFTFNPQFTDETAACMVISDTIFAMLLTHEKFAEFTDREIADAHKTSQVLLALSRDDRAAVDSIADAALAAGGSEPRPAQDMGFMYSRAFADLDGHVWEPMWMDPAAVQG